jgi:hypothetical protein
MTDKSLSPSPPSKHSRLGIASYILAILANLIVIGDMAIVLRLQKNPTVVQNFAVIDPMLTWLTAILATAGLGLGIAAVVRKEKKRVFGYSGLIVNGLVLLGIFSLYVINALVLMRAAGG